MKMLHILRSTPIPMVKEFMQAFSNDHETDQFLLYEKEVDYSVLVKRIFENDNVISWW